MNIDIPAQSDAVYEYDMNEIEDSTDIDVGVVTKLSGGLEVKILKKAKKCLRQVWRHAGYQWHKGS